VLLDREVGRHRGRKGIDNKAEMITGHGSILGAAILVGRKGYTSPVEKGKGFNGSRGPEPLLVLDGF
jgi:hypothetical protein